jgi:hypothetical protein
MNDHRLPKRIGVAETSHTIDELVRTRNKCSPSVWRKANLA